ncbi:MAG: hypothetical protein JKY96_05930 [Phycisphaerales bacterium]|nr:hypothetical protein [Phycisphaerales bacterium]
MKLNTPISGLTFCAVLAASLSVLPACEQKSSSPQQDVADKDEHEHGPDGEHADHDDMPAASTAGHGGAVIALGTSVIGPFDVRATRDEGLIVAGKDAPIDITVTPTAGSTIKAAAVRFWIGTKDAKGSVKAKSEVENPAEPNRWHTHAEVPNPIPEGSKLWVEIETDNGETVIGSFELKS